MTLFVIRRLGLLVGALFLSSIVIFVLLRLAPWRRRPGPRGNRGFAREDRGPSCRARARPVVPRAVHRLDRRHPARRLRALAAQQQVGARRAHEQAHRDRAARAVLVGPRRRGGGPARVRGGRATRQVPTASRSTSSSQLGIAVPSFFVGLLLVVVVSVKWDLLPAQGFPTDGWDDPAEALAGARPSRDHAGDLPGCRPVPVRAVGRARRDRAGLHAHRPRQGPDPVAGPVRHGLRNASVPIVLDPRCPDRQPDRRRPRDRTGVQPPRRRADAGTDIGTRDLEKVQGTVLLLAVIVLVIGFVVDILHRSSILACGSVG